MPRLCCWLMMFAISGQALAAPEINDYAYQALLSESDQPLQRVDLPIDVMQNLTQRDLGDIALFNANGKRLPHSVIATPSVVTDLDLELPFHEFDRFTRERSRTVTTREQNRQNGSISELSTTETQAIQSVRKDYLIELKPDNVSRQFNSVELQWTHEPESQVLEIRVEAGDELDKLRVIYPRKSLTNRQSDDPKWRSIDGLPADRRYLRLTAVNEIESFVLTRVVGHYQETTTAAMLSSPVELKISEENDGRYYSFALPSAVPAESWRIIPAEANTVINIDLYTTWPGSDNRVRIRHGISQHNIINAEVKPSQPIRLPARNFERIWFKSNQALTGTPSVELNYRPYQAYFLGDGNGPYTLAWGNHAPESQASNLTTLLQRSLREAQSQVATVTPGPRQLAGGPARLAPEPTLPWKKWLLWGLLILAAAVTGRMAFRLYREMNTGNPA